MRTKSPIGPRAVLLAFLGVLLAVAPAVADTLDDVRKRAGWSSA